MATKNATKQLTCPEFARKIILGPGGMEDYANREIVVYHEDIRVHAAEWAMRCLANPDCEGSDVALEAILERRARLAKEKGATFDRKVSATRGN